MADINQKPKLQLRAGISVNGDKTPSPATKLLINHGKPNFTIQRSPKIQNGNGTNGNPLSPQPVAPKSEFVVRSTTFNGVFKPSNVSPVATKPTLLKQNGNISNNNVNNNNNNNGEHEMAKVVLRRTKVPEPAVKEGEDENVPEFILRQRRIQERLAKENLDFENRRSGYFTQVLISPSSPNRKSFVETMSSPAVMPSLEIPPPETKPEKIVEEESQEEKKGEEQVLQEIAKEIVEEEAKVEESKVEEAKVEEPKVEEQAPVTENGHDAEEEEVNKAIEEVNKAVAGEDDDKAEEEPEKEVVVQEVVVTSAPVEEVKPESEEPAQVAVVTSAVETEEMETKPQEPEAPVQAVVTSALLVEEEQKPQENGHTEVAQEKPLENGHTVEEEAETPHENGHVEAVVVTSAPLVEEEEKPQENGHVEAAEPQTNGHEITISHTNASTTPSIPSPDPSGEKGVNFEPKTVVSFSRELGDVNKYPDTVKVVKDVESPKVDDELKELAKLKFEIKADDQDIEVKPVLKVE
ncbi:general transcriptional corepressor trfA [Musca vetustissima]|uniref:general transcriptional corepressor trfA n=1 Tax=Musca vetustissima TaxID=27455 RepID=UPI002AB63633|nr:general transcriptional corepressor trfA [Musca vetustissima]